MTDEQKAMIHKYQCPGCVCGSSPEDECYTPIEESTGDVSCGKHVPGTMLMGCGSLYLGLPTGFNRVGMRHEILRYASASEPKVNGECHNLRLWASPDLTHSVWNHLNVPVWALEKDGVLFVRTYLPRLNTAYIDVVQGGTLALVPQALDVSAFLDDID